MTFTIDTLEFPIYNGVVELPENGTRYYYDSVEDVHEFGFTTKANSYGTSVVTTYVEELGEKESFTLEYECRKLVGTEVDVQINEVLFRRILVGDCTIEHGVFLRGTKKYLVKIDWTLGAVISEGGGRGFDDEDNYWSRVEVFSNKTWQVLDSIKCAQASRGYCSTPGSALLFEYVEGKSLPQYSVIDNNGQTVILNEIVRFPVRISVPFNITQGLKPALLADGSLDESQANWTPVWLGTTLSRDMGLISKDPIITKYEYKAIEYHWNLSNFYPLFQPQITPITDGGGVAYQALGKDLILQPDGRANRIRDPIESKTTSFVPNDFYILDPPPAQQNLSTALPWKALDFIQTQANMCFRNQTGVFTTRRYSPVYNILGQGDSEFQLQLTGQTDALNNVVTIDYSGLSPLEVLNSVCKTGIGYSLDYDNTSLEAGRVSMKITSHLAEQFRYNDVVIPAATAMQELDLSADDIEFYNLGQNYSRVNKLFYVEGGNPFCSATFGVDLKGEAPDNDPVPCFEPAWTSFSQDLWEAHPDIRENEQYSNVYREYRIRRFWDGIYWRNSQQDQDTDPTFVTGSLENDRKVTYDGDFTKATVEDGLLEYNSDLGFATASFQLVNSLPLPAGSPASSINTGTTVDVEKQTMAKPKLYLLLNNGKGEFVDIDITIKDNVVIFGKNSQDALVIRDLFARTDINLVMLVAGFLHPLAYRKGIRNSGEAQGGLEGLKIAYRDWMPSTIKMIDRRLTYRKVYAGHIDGINENGKLVALANPGPLADANGVIFNSSEQEMDTSISMYSRLYFNRVDDLVYNKLATIDIDTVKCGTLITKLTLPTGQLDESDELITEEIDINAVITQVVYNFDKNKLGTSYKAGDINLNDAIDVDDQGPVTKAGNWSLADLNYAFGG